MTATPRKPLIKKISTARRNYIYDTWTNEIIEVDNAIFNILPGSSPKIDLKTEFTEPERERALREIEEAKRDGFFREDRPEIESFPEEHLSEIVDQAMQEGPEHIILSITERCNMLCRYCIYSGAYDFERTHSKRSMSWNGCKKITRLVFSPRSP